MIQIQSVLQIPEQTLPVYGLGQITEYMEPHGFIQIFGIRSNNKNDNIFTQLVERDLAKVEVAGPSPVCRSFLSSHPRSEEHTSELQSH